MNINLNNPIIRFMLNQIQHYNHKKYWGMRKKVIDPQSKLPKFIRLYYLLKIKRMDAYNNASMGTDLDFGAIFADPPILRHGLNGIIVSHYAKIGYHCTIFQGVTIAEDGHSNSATIGNNCLIGAGAVIIGGVKIGDNVNIGANAVVVNDIPSNCTVIGAPAKIVKINKVQKSKVSYY